MILKSKKEWLTERFQEVCKAISEKYNALEPIPVEWIQEYNELIELISE